MYITFLGLGPCSGKLERRTNLLGRISHLRRPGSTRLLSFLPPLRTLRCVKPTFLQIHSHLEYFGQKALFDVCKFVYYIYYLFWPWYLFWITVHEPPARPMRETKNQKVYFVFEVSGFAHFSLLQLCSLVIIIKTSLRPKHHQWQPISSVWPPSTHSLTRPIWWEPTLSSLSSFCNIQALLVALSEKLKRAKDIYFGCSASWGDPSGHKNSGDKIFRVF